MAETARLDCRVESDRRDGDGGPCGCAVFFFFSVQADVAVVKRGVTAARTMLHRGNNVG